MRHSCFSKILLILVLFINAFGNEKTAVCFYYDHSPPEEMFYLCDYLVVDPSHNIEKKGHSKLLAYVSLEEGESYRDYFKDIKDEWVIGKNIHWKTVILDLRNEEYQKFLIKRVFNRLKDYDGFFLDTLDSYQIALKDKRSKAEYQDALVGFIKRLKNLYPDKEIIINRGFEIVKRVEDTVDAVAVESLFYGLDPGSMDYRPVPEKDRRWSLEKLSSIKLPVIVIDYLPPKEKKKALEISKKIQEKGFIPWIIDKDLKTFGTSYFQFIPRKVLILYDGKAVKKEYSAAHRLGSLVFEYLGYIPVLWDINRGLPDGYTVDRYAGIVVWLQSQTVENYQDFYRWVRKKIDEGNRLVFVESFGFPLEEKYLRPLGIDIFKNRSGMFDNEKIIYKEDIFDFEAELSLEYSDLLLYPEKGRPLIKVENSKGQIYSPASITPWGGYILNGAFLKTDIEDLWVVNPFKFFKKALRLRDIPAPDTTTENGRRILFVHIDGDGFMERTEWEREKFASEIIKEKIIKIFRIPHTVSVIEGEIAPYGLYPDLSHKLEDIARQIFRLDNVEAASHSFSHPFKWEKLYDGKQNRDYSLPIKNYTFDLKREIIGSVDYINRRLLPENKKVKVFQWTGDCMPPAEAVRLTYEAGLLNINGGDTKATKKEPYLVYVSPMGIDKDGYFQVYSAMQNENIYTDEWKGPFYGYQNVIQTFELTEKPRRLKPINIYYHFYSGSKIASLKALQKVYRYALSQEVTPLYTSEWIKRVLDFRKIALGFDGKNWIVSGDGDLRTLRFDRPVDINIKESSGVVGYRKEKNRTYIHLDGSGRYLISEGKPEFPYIRDFNGIVKGFIKDKKKMKITLKSYIPAELTVYKPESCDLRIKNRDDYIVERDGYFRYIFTEKGEIIIEGDCR